MCSVSSESVSLTVSMFASSWVKKTYCSRSFFSWSCKKVPTISVSVRGTGSAISQSSSDFLSTSICSTPSSRPSAEVGGAITALIAPAAAVGSKDAAKSAAIDSGFIMPEPLASPAISWGPGLAESTFVSGADPKAAATCCKASASFSALVGILPPSLVAACLNSIGVNPDMAQKGMRDRMREAQFSFDRDDRSFTWAKMETFCSSEHCRHIHAFQQASQAKWKCLNDSSYYLNLTLKMEECPSTCWYIALQSQKGCCCFSLTSLGFRSSQNNVACKNWMSASHSHGFQGEVL